MLLKVLYKCCNTDVLGILLIYPHSGSMQSSGVVGIIPVKLLAAVFNIITIIILMYNGYFTGSFLFKYSVIFEDAILRHIVTHVTTLCGMWQRQRMVV